MLTCANLGYVGTGKLSGKPSKLLDEIYPATMGLPYGENCIILTSTIYDWSIHVTDGQKNGR